MSNQNIYLPFPDYDKIHLTLSQIVPVVNSSYIDDSLAFSVIFRESFINDIPAYEMEPGNFGASPSNWTYHIAQNIRQTAKTLDLNCWFEANGRRDAVIQTYDSPPEIILMAEWEWNYNDIFGKGKELEKLAVSCKNYVTANAFLLTYCPVEKYGEFLEKVGEFWVMKFRKDKNPPNLFFHTIVFIEKKRIREIQALRTCVINPLEINIWNERFFNK